MLLKQLIIELSMPNDNIIPKVKPKKIISKALKLKENMTRRKLANNQCKEPQNDSNV